MMIIIYHHNNCHNQRVVDQIDENLKRLLGSHYGRYLGKHSPTIETIENIYQVICPKY